MMAMYARLKRPGASDILLDEQKATSRGFSFFMGYHVIATKV